MIDGNTELVVQSLSDSVKYDENGKKIVEYKSKKTILGWLDLITGDSNYNHKAKIEDSSHVFVCDYIDLSDVNIEESKALIDNEVYDIKYIDNPMQLNYHLEIYLKKIGGQEWQKVK